MSFLLLFATVAAAYKQKLNNFPVFFFCISIIWSIFFFFFSNFRCNSWPSAIPVWPEQFDNNLTLSKKLSLLAAEKINENIDLIISKKANFIDQNHDQATYAGKISKNESKINWNNDAKNINAKIICGTSKNLSGCLFSIQLSYRN